MKAKSVIRAWKDEEYRLALSNDEQTPLPAHPAGALELTDAELGAAAGGTMILFPSFVCPSWGAPCLTRNGSICICKPW